MSAVAKTQNLQAATDLIVSEIKLPGVERFSAAALKRSSDLQISSALKAATAKNTQAGRYTGRAYAQGAYGKYAGRTGFGRRVVTPGSDETAVSETSDDPLCAAEIDPNEVIEETEATEEVDVDDANGEAESETAATPIDRTNGLPDTAANSAVAAAQNADLGVKSLVAAEPPTAVTLYVPCGGLLDAWWYELSPQATLAIMNGMARAAKSASISIPRVPDSSPGAAEHREQLDRLTRALATAKAEAATARDDGRRVAQQQAESHVRDLRASVARLEKELSAKSAEREEKLVKYMERLLGQNSSGHSVGEAGEKLVESKLEELLPEYELENINEDRKSLDRLATHRDDGFRILIEVKNKSEVSKKDRDEFEQAVRLNLKGAHAAVLLALRAERVAMRGKYSRATVGTVPAVYMAGVVADNWQPVRLAVEMLHAEHLSRTAQSVRERDREARASEALHDMLAVHRDLAEARRQTAALSVVLGRAGPSADRVLESLRLSAPAGFEDRDGRSAKSLAARSAAARTAKAASARPSTTKAVPSVPAAPKPASPVSPSNESDTAENDGSEIREKGPAANGLSDADVDALLDDM